MASIREEISRTSAELSDACGLPFATLAPFIPVWYRALSSIPNSNLVPAS